MSVWIFSFVFNYVYVMTGGGPGAASTVAELEIFRQGFSESQPGYASAISLILVAITLPLIVAQVRSKSGGVGRAGDRKAEPAAAVAGTARSPVPTGAKPVGRLRAILPRLERAQAAPGILRKRVHLAATGEF